MYEVSYSQPAMRYFKKIKDKHLKAAFRVAIGKLSADPYIGEQKTGDLRGMWGFDVNYATVNYEIAYRIYEENGRQLVVILAGTRENFYEELKRLAK
ncbi:MAG: type II toxin-antitoxin system RelE/ParE family toxin [Clostridiales Family XIII bacterium]|jgi:mRNA interferase RelE/StbE|nr:type II toxin-antitoxin system RelE/ParE family toxin [Clostridiales Family XIII bacterium]